MSKVRGKAKVYDLYDIPADIYAAIGEAPREELQDAFDEVKGQLEELDRDGVKPSHLRFVLIKYAVIIGLALEGYYGERQGRML